MAGKTCAYLVATTIATYLLTTTTAQSIQWARPSYNQDLISRRKAPIPDPCIKVKSSCPVPENVNATLLPNPDDCASYCECVWGNPVWMPCPEGLHFNPTLHVCDYPREAGCGDVAPSASPTTESPTPTKINTAPSITSTAGYHDNDCLKIQSLCPVPENVNVTILPNPDDCGSYCVCIWGTPVWMPCPPGLHFNPVMKICDKPSHAGCDFVPNTPTDGPATRTSAPEKTTNGLVTTTGASNTTTGPIKNGCSKVKSLCPMPEEQNATLLPNPDDCGSYCACVWGNPVYMECPPGLYFNPSLKVCDWPVNAGCGSVPNTPTVRPVTSTSAPEKTTNGLVTTTGASNTTTGPIKNGCPKVKSLCPIQEEQNATLLPNPDDCGSYCACVLGNPIYMECPPGLYFNPSLKVCDWPVNAGCGSVPNTPTDRPVTSTPASDNTTNGHVTSTGASNTTTRPIKNGCPKVKSLCPMPEEQNATLLPNPDDCGSYCSCVWGNPVYMECPPGLHFNPSLKVCDWPSHAGCSASPNPPTGQPPITTTTEGHSPATNNPSTAAPLPTGHVTVTKDHFTTLSAQETTTQGSGGHTEHGCLKVKSQCPVPEKKNATLLPNPDDCGSYCVCIWGTPVWMPCAPGLHFNPISQICDRPIHAGCASVPNPTTESPYTTNAPPTDNVTSTQESNTTTQPIRNGCSKVKSLCPMPEERNATLLPNPDDCGSYCACVWGNPVYMECPPGLYFNPSLKVCDWPVNAGCGSVPNTPTDRPVTSTPAPDNTTNGHVTSTGASNTTTKPIKNGCPKVKSLCPMPEEQNATLLPNPDDCGSYCACVWGNSVYMECPPGLHFNPSLKVCDWPSNSGCGAAPNPPTNKPSTPVPIPTENVTVTEILTTAGHSLNGCHKVTSQCPLPEKDNATLLPNPDDCGSYCACVWGKPVWMPCPDGLHFNPELHVCDFPKHAGCGSAPAPPSEKPTPEPTVFPPTGSPGDNISTPSSNGTNGCFKVKSFCPDPEKVNATLLPNPDDCSSYCACAWGNPIWMPCPVGLHFNPTLHVCDYPYEAGCLAEATTNLIPA